MTKYIILNKKKNIKKIQKIINNLNLSNTLKNKRTSMWENDDIQINIDKSIIRILIYSIDDVTYYSNIIESASI